MATADSSKDSAVQTCKHEPVNCPRCGSEFLCKPGSITLCHCFDVKLSPEQQEWIAERWQGCLCGACLREVAESNLNEGSDVIT